MYKKDYSMFQGNPDILPDGTKFLFWKDETAYTKEYHVDTNAENATDSGVGNAEEPFKTINKAASVVKPGEKVIIHSGVYRETVCDIHGGSDEKHMVKFEADGEVVITGAEDWVGSFKPSEGYRQTDIREELDLFSLDDSVYYSEHVNAKVWMGKIPKHFFIGYNPFAVMNSPNVGFIPYGRAYPMLMRGDIANYLEREPLIQKRGLMFCDGERMKQVTRVYDLWSEEQCDENIYWVAEGGLEIHFRLKGDDTPDNHRFELAVREQGFAPEEAGQAFIYLDGIKFEKFSNPYIPPQKGAVSTFCGHHWIIENCKVDQVNTVGIDLGFQSHHAAHEGLRGYHILRYNTISNCGINAICALPTRGRSLENVLIEHNRIEHCCWQNSERLWESSSIKNHFTKNCLYRFNVIIDTHYGCSIWLDKSNANSRVCYNTFIGCRSTMYGMVFLEASFVPNMIDHNFISGVHRIFYPKVNKREGGHGIYQHEVDNMIVLNNMIHDVEGYGVFMLYTKDTRVFQGNRGVFNRGNCIIENVIHNASGAIWLPTEKNYSDGNVFGCMRGRYDFFIEDSGEKHNMESYRQYYGFEKNSCYADKFLMNVSQKDCEVSVEIVTSRKNMIYNGTLSTADELLAFFEQIDKLTNISVS